MTAIRRIQAKLFLDPATSPKDYTVFIGLLQRWIQEAKLPELLLDVADYTHVHEGPGVVLVGHESDYGMDVGHGGPGLLCFRKRTKQGEVAGAEASDTPALIADAVGRVARAAVLLEAETLEGDSGKLRFDARRLMIRVPDKLGAPNTDHNRGAIEAELRTLFAARGFDALELKWETRDTYPMAVWVNLGRSCTASELSAAFAGE